MLAVYRERRLATVFMPDNTYFRQKKAGITPAFHFNLLAAITYNARTALFKRLLLRAAAFL